jgi:thiol-disulfide isomerase/thioredoxin
MQKSIQNLILVAIATLLLTAQFLQGTDVKVFKLKSIDPSNDVNKASNFYWENAGVETNLFKEANGRTIILTFLGTWCPYCTRHLPELKKLYDELPKGDYYFINVFGETSLSAEPKVKSEVEAEKLEYDNVWYSNTEPMNMQLFQYYNITKVIMTLIILPDKKIVSYLPDIISTYAKDTLSKYVTGVNDNNQNPDLKISPNPTSGLALLQYSVSEPCDVIFNVYNSLGAEVYSLSKKEYNSGISGIQFDVNTFAQGMYYYTLQMGKKIYTDKLIIVR